MKKKNLRQKRTKIDIANEREVKKRELEELIDSVEDENIPEDVQEKIDVLQDEISALEEELMAIEEPEQDEERHIKVIGPRQPVSQRFSILTAVRNIVENRSHDNLTQTILDIGKTELSRAGISPRGQIVIPENRDAIQATIASKGLEAIATEKLDMIGPLYAELVLSKLGVTFLNGLVSDISIPVYTGTTTGWAGEISPAIDGAGTTREIRLKPKRLTAYTDISKQFILQDSVSAEALLRSDLIEAIRQKLEQTLLGGEAGSDTRPPGLFAPGAVEIPIVTNYEEFLEAEMSLLTENAAPKFYLASPLAYANLRQITKPESLVVDKTLNVAVGSSIVDSNTVSGIPLNVSANVYSFTQAAAGDDPAVTYGGYLVGDFSNYVVAQWGNIDLTVDPYTRSIDGCIRLIVNAYFDAVLKRPTVRAVLTPSGGVTKTAGIVHPITGKKIGKA